MAQQIQLQGVFEANGKWEEVSKDEAWEAFKSQCDPVSGEVVGHDAEWGDRTYQIRLTRRDGGIACVNLSKQSTLKEGDKIKLESLVMITLSRGTGDKKETIYRYDAEKA